MAPILGYWDLRGLAEPLRYLLHYKNVEFEDKRYTDYETWQSDKLNLGLEFPNLPYFIDGEVRATQSLAIIRYLAKKYDLCGADISDCGMLKIETVEQQLIDLRTRMAMVCYDDKMEEKREDYKKILQDVLEMWSKYLGDNPFFMGDCITYVDFLAYDIFDYHDMFLPEVVGNFPNLQDFMRRFENLPQLQDYMKSPVYKRWPFFSPAAKFGGGGEEPKRQ